MVEWEGECVEKREGGVDWWRCKYVLRRACYAVWMAGTEARFFQGS